MADQNYGLMQMVDLGILNPQDTAANANRSLIVAGVNYDRAQHNTDINAMLGVFANTGTEDSIYVQQYANSRNQPLDENGRSIPVKPPAPYTVRIPVQFSGSATGENYITSQLMTNRELSARLSTLYRGDLNWVADHVLNGIFAKAGYSIVDQGGRGDMTVSGLANGDTVEYTKRPGTAPGTDDHYYAQAADIGDAANPFPTLRDEIREHPDNQGQLVAFIASDLRADVEGLAEFRERDADPDFTYSTAETRLTGTFQPPLPDEMEVIGKLKNSNMWVVEWTRLPSSYGIVMTDSGPKPLRRRVMAAANLQGFAPQGERQDFPYFETQWGRYEGYGAQYRTAAVAFYIGSGTWANPTGYGVVMP